jgi:hypothetical protein
VVPTRLQNIVGPSCPRCGTRMWLALIEPDLPDYDRRTFQCTACSYELSLVVKFR